MRSPSQRAGDAAESQALAYLRQAGLKLVNRNWECRFGEIDLIMHDDSALVFVEVRRRTIDGRYPSAADSVGPRKRTRLLRTARCYLSTLRRPTPLCRFDVVIIEEDSHGTESLSWIRDAFHET